MGRFQDFPPDSLVASPVDGNAIHHPVASLCQCNVMIKNNSAYLRRAGWGRALQRLVLVGGSGAHVNRAPGTYHAATLASLATVLPWVGLDWGGLG